MENPPKGMSLKAMVKYIMLQMVLFIIIGFGTIAAIIFTLKVNSAAIKVQHTLESVSTKDLKHEKRG